MGQPEILKGLAAKTLESRHESSHESSEGERALFRM